ncbi:RlpA-like double-psi beta-barrel-protein domain-containing protein-containing protein, partial [Cercophora newfieldiana]
RTGELTFFQVGLGACGFNDAGKDKTENIVALSHLLMGEQSNGNPYCGKTITVSYGGKTAQAVVRDKCMGCAFNNIDGTEKLFGEFAALTVGRMEVQWWF